MGQPRNAFISSITGWAPRRPPGARSDLTESGRALQVIVRRIIFSSAGIHLTE